jgi:hypothetical protein
MRTVELADGASGAGRRPWFNKNTLAAKRRTNGLTKSPKYRWRFRVQR